jgi:hypothetical protein
LYQPPSTYPLASGSGCSLMTNLPAGLYACSFTVVATNALCGTASTNLVATGTVYAVSIWPTNFVACAACTNVACATRFDANGAPVGGDYSWDAGDGTIVSNLSTVASNNSSVWIVFSGPTATEYVTATYGPGCTATSTGRVHQVQSVVWQEINLGTTNSFLDANPPSNPGGGWRIFPDKQNPGDITNHAIVLVRATVTPAFSNVVVYFTSFDVRDPTHVMPLTNITTRGVDNVRRPQYGSLTPSTHFALTDASGAASNYFRVTMQPGDNFRVVASCDPNFASQYQADINSTTGGIVDTNGFPIASGYVTDMLTVWRRLHVEVDSMAAVVNNSISGNVTGITDGISIPHKALLNVNLRTGLTPNDNSSNLDVCVTCNGRFENGRITIGDSTTTGLMGNGDTYVSTQSGDWFNIPFGITGSNGSSPIVTGQIIGLAVISTIGDSFFTVNTDLTPGLFDGGIINVAGQTFDVFTNGVDTVNVIEQGILPFHDLHDDDYDTLLPHSYDLSVLSAALQQAYVSVVDDGGGNTSNNQMNNTFAANLTTNQIEQSFNRQANGDDAFWVAYVLMSYQYTTDSDFDPDSEGGTGGVTLDVSDNCTVESGGVGSQVFVETVRDRLANGGDVIGLEARVLAHEVGHQMGLAHWDIDSSGQPLPCVTDPIPPPNLMLSYVGDLSNSQATFVPQHLKLLRLRIHTPGQ